VKKTLRPSGGHILDIDATELNDTFLTRAHNVQTRKGFPSRIGGRRVAYSAITGIVDPLHLLNFNLNTFNWWLAFGADSIIAVESANDYDVSYATQSSVINPHEWSSTLLNGIPIFTNGKDPLLFWTGDSADDADEVDDWPVGTICRAVVAFRYHVFAMNIDSPAGSFENLVMWSDATEPGALPASWTPSASNEAGSTILADTPGRCITGLPLDTRLMIYKPQSLYAAEYVGQQPDNIFTFRPISRSIGALGPNTVREWRTQHVVMGNDDIVLTDGVNIQSIAEDRIKRSLMDSIDETNSLNCFIVSDISRKELWFCVPEAGNQFANIAHVWDASRNSWVTRDLNAVRYGTIGYVADNTVDDTWDGAVGDWDSDLQAWSAGSTGAQQRVVTAELDTLYVEGTSDIVTVTSRLVRQGLDFGDDTQRKLVGRVYLNGSGLGANSFRFRLGKQLDSDDSIEWGAYVDYDSTLGKPYEIEGRYIAIEIENSSNDPWTLNRIIIEAVYSGPY
jgi:hypothetical protein